MRSKSQVKNSREILLARWRDLCRRLALHGDCAGEGSEILRRYCEPHRPYHNSDHLADCLSTLDLHAAEADDPLAVELALWFHDAVYTVGVGDNEERSAALAVQSLNGLRASQELTESVRAMIIVTKHKVEPPPGDARLVCDIDLGILGARPERYDVYAGAVFAESGLPMDSFSPLRVAFLEGMLAKPHVYHTATFRRELEMGARQNMAREQRELTENG